MRIGDELVRANRKQEREREREREREKAVQKSDRDRCRHKICHVTLNMNKTSDLRLVSRTGKAAVMKKEKEVEWVDVSFALSPPASQFNFPCVLVLCEGTPGTFGLTLTLTQCTLQLKDAGNFTSRVCGV